MSRRLRKHANPFNVTTQVGTIDRLAVFGREAPLEVDVGCGEGGFLIQRALANPDIDFVGFEVRKPIVELGLEARDKRGVKNLQIYYASCTDNLAIAAPGVIRMFSVQFPDPCFKKRHWKRRILQPKIVRTMTELLPLGGRIYCQSDVEPLAEEMEAFLLAETGLTRISERTLLIPSPFVERTEWETHHERNGEPVYRMMFEKYQEPSGPIPEVPFRNTNPRHPDVGLG